MFANNRIMTALDGCAFVILDKNKYRPPYPLSLGPKVHNDKNLLGIRQMKTNPY